MTVVSKELFYRKVPRDAQCDIIHVWHSNCLKSIGIFCHQVIIGAGKFYITIYLIQTVLRYKKVNRNYIKGLILAYFRSIFYGIVYGTNFHSSICLFAKLFGQLHYYCMGLLPGAFAGSSIFVESKEMIHLNTLIYSTLVIEVCLRHLQQINVLPRNTVQQTAVFMLFNSLLMLLMSKRKSKTFLNFWFFRPPQMTAETDGCVHEKSCTQHCFQTTLRYFLVGYGVSFARLLSANLKQLGNKIGQLLFNRKHFVMGAFLAAFAGFYNMLTCWLLKKYTKRKEWHVMFAGLLSGVSYGIQPNLQIMSLAASTIGQLYFQNRIGETVLEKYHLKECLFITCTAVLTHVFFANQDICPRYFANMYNKCTNGLVMEGYRNVFGNYICV